jgi:chromosome segregation ATPase
MVQNTVEKAYKAAKTSSSHRDWEPQTEELKQKEQLLKEYQQQIELQKKKVRGLKNRLNALTNMEKMVHVNNELTDAERRRKKLEDEVRILKKNNKYQEKALGKLADDTDYETKLQMLSQELSTLRDEYRQMGKDHKAKELAQMDHHQRLVSVEEENSRLKRILIALKNNKDPFEGTNDIEEMMQGGKKEVESYEQSIKSEEKRHKIKMKKMEEAKEAVRKEIEELEKQVKEAEKDNQTMAERIRNKKKMVKVSGFSNEWKRRGLTDIEELYGLNRLYRRMKRR